MHTLFDIHGVILTLTWVCLKISVQWTVHSHCRVNKLAYVTWQKKNGLMYTKYILQYVSPLLFEILEIYEIPYEKLHEWCKFNMMTYKVVSVEIQKCGQISWGEGIKDPYIYIGSSLLVADLAGLFALLDSAIEIIIVFLINCNQILIYLSCAIVHTKCWVFMDMLPYIKADLQFS